MIFEHNTARMALSLPGLSPPYYGFLHIPNILKYCFIQEYYSLLNIAISAMDSNLDTLSITVALPTEIWEAILSNLTEPEDVAHLWATVRKVNKMFHDLVETLAIPWLKRMRLLILNHYQCKSNLLITHYISRHY